MDKLIDYICDELDELEHKADKGKLSMAEMQYLDMLAHAKKNLLKGDEMMDGESYADGRTPIYYRARDGRDGRDGMSNARGRRRDSRGRYSSGRYAMANDMVDELRDMMNDAPDERTRMEFQKFITKMESM